MGEKDNQEVTLFAGGKPVGYSKEAKVTMSGDNTNDSDSTFRNMSEKNCYTMSFDMQENEEAKAFFKRMEDEMKEKETAILERIESLFNEYIGLESKVGKEETDEAYKRLLTLFSIGYRLGWNDYYRLNTIEKENEKSE